MDEITKEQTKSLADIARAAFYETAEVKDSYDDAWESAAQAVAAHVRAESAAEIERLKTELRNHAVYMEYDCPGDAPEPCGEWCKVCNQHVDDNKISGHAETCLLFVEAAL